MFSTLMGVQLLSPGLQTCFLGINGGGDTEIDLSPPRRDRGKIGERDSLECKRFEQSELKVLLHSKSNSVSLHISLRV